MIISFPSGENFFPLFSYIFCIYHAQVYSVINSTFVFFLHTFRIQIPWRAGIAAEAVVHVLAVHFERQEQVFVCGVRVNAELGEIAEKTFAGAAYVTGVREGLFRLGEECLDFISS
jgi:hypothetical protein